MSSDVFPSASVIGRPRIRRSILRPPAPGTIRPGESRESPGAGRPAPRGDAVCWADASPAGTIARPGEGEYAPFYAGYVALVPEADILAVLERRAGELRELAASVPAERETHRYAEGKWSVREVLGHLVDGERVFGYRAFCISRGERELADELGLVREPNLAFLRRLSPRDWERMGTASGKPISVRALAWIMAGHPRHHVRSLREHYGVR
jgi:DinB superfamily